MKKLKIILVSVALVLVIGVVAVSIWWLRRPQVITFSDDAKVTLLKVDYGKKHAPPDVKVTTGTRVRRGNSFTTTNDTLVLWVRQEHDPQQYANFQYYLYDKAGTACAVSYGFGGYSYGRQGGEIVGIQFQAFPRRQGEFIVRIQEQGNGGQEMSDQKFVVRNPARKSFPAWTAEPLPDTQADDDLSVTLTKLVSGAAMPYTRDQDNPDDAVNKGVQAVFHVERNGNAVTNWEPVSVRTSDATGNQVSWNSMPMPMGGMPGAQWQDNDYSMAYQYGLWPDEAAWKLRVEFSQRSNFADSEMWSVQNIPVQPGRQMDFFYNRRNLTDSAFAETDLNGFHLKIFSAKRFTDMPPNAQPPGGLLIQAEPPLPGGMRLTIVKLTDDQTNDVGFWENTFNQNKNVSVAQCQLRDIDGVTNLNLTIALHKSRFVEFTVKPEKAPSAAAAGDQ